MEPVTAEAFFHQLVSKAIGAGFLLLLAVSGFFARREFKMRDEYQKRMDETFDDIYERLEEKETELRDLKQQLAVLTREHDLRHKNEPLPRG